jgi:DNA-directed RNA polymerase subunit omega
MEKVSSRFQLVHMAAKRVRQIREGSEYLVSSPKNEDIVVALREIAAEKVRAKTVEIETDEPSESLLSPVGPEAPEVPVEPQEPKTEESPETDV